MTHEQIFEQLGVTGASDEVKQSILHNLVGAVEIQFASVGDELLTEEQDEELNKLVDAHDGDPSVVGEWLKLIYQRLDNYTRQYWRMRLLV